MDTEVIHQQTKGRLITALAKGAQKTVLQMPDRQSPGLAKPVHPVSTGSSPPGQQSIRTLAPTSAGTNHQFSGSEQLRQAAMRKHSLYWHP